MHDYQELFAAEGASREVTGNQPLPLDDPDRVWLVQSGRVDVFGVPLRDGQPAGARAHLFRAEAGQVLFGVAPDAAAAASGLLATGIPGCRLVGLPKARLRELAADPGLAGQVGGLLDGWVRSLTAGAAGERPPRSLTPLEPGQEIRCEGPGMIGPARGTLWVRPVQGAAQFLGKTGLCVRPGDSLFPLAAPGWLEVREHIRLAALPTAAALDDPALWSGLDRFHRMILECIADNAREASAVQLERLRRREEADQSLVRSTLSQLAAAQSPGGDANAAVAGAAPDVLFAACQLLGQRLGIDFQPPLTAGVRRQRSDAVSAIARASRVRARRVLLAGAWWRQDNGPLLAFRTADEHPVALLPTSPSSYEMIDPRTQTRVPVTATKASALAPFATTFYRPFPARALAPRDLVRFGWVGGRRDLLGIVLMGLTGGLLGMVTPVATGMIFDRIIPGAERTPLLLLVLAMAACAMAGLLFQLTQSLALLRLETRMEGAVEAGVWDRLLSLPVPFFRQFTAGDLAARAGGIGAIRQVLTDVVLSSLLTGVFSLVYFVLLFYYSVKLALVAALLVGLSVLVSYETARCVLGYQRGIYEARGKISGLVLQLLTGISRLRVAGAERRALAVWARAFGRQRGLAFRMRSLGNNVAAFDAALPLLTAMVLFGAVALTSAADLSLGAFLAFSVAFYHVVAATGVLSSAATSLVQIVPMYERAKPILQTLPEVDPAKADPGELSGDIEINGVSFRYHPAGPLILDNVSAHIRPGEFVAFVGPSGAGKSTLVRLLLGFETPTAGSIYYDRADLAGLDLQAVRQQIGVVLQHGRLMSGDIFSNIIGSSLLTLDDAWEAARRAGLDEDIDRMPMGMYTVIGEGESTLSGGQRQRLMIARAVVSRPRVLLFDEATSALDNETQAVVSRSLERLKATRVVVAHRLSTIRHADRIYVLDGGRVVQQGRYQELVGQEGLFADLVQRQLA